MIKKYSDLLRIVWKVSVSRIVPSTGHQIAIACSEKWSRATTYRYLKLMEKRGLIEKKITSSGHEWKLTMKGQFYVNG